MMDLTASAIKPGHRSLNRTSMDVRCARGAIKDPSHAKSRDVLHAKEVAKISRRKEITARYPGREIYAMISARNI